MGYMYLFANEFKCEHHADRWLKCVQCNPPGDTIRGVQDVFCCHKKAAWCCDRCRHLVLILKSSSYYKFNRGPKDKLTKDDFISAYDYFKEKGCKTNGSPFRTTEVSSQQTARTVLSTSSSNNSPKSATVESKERLRKRFSNPKGKENQVDLDQLGFNFDFQNSGMQRQEGKKIKSLSSACHSNSNTRTRRNLNASFEKEKETWETTPKGRDTGRSVKPEELGARDARGCTMETSPIKSEKQLLETCKFLLAVLSVLLRTVGYVIRAAWRLLRPLPLKDVNGQIALVTGAGHGIGRQLAIQLSQLGCDVICVDINAESNQQVVDIINKQNSGENDNDGVVIKGKGGSAGMRPGQAFAYSCDVSDRLAVFRLAAEVCSRFGRVDILVNNAGIMPPQPILDTDPADVVNIVNINLLAHFWTIMAFLPKMIENGSGHIVAVSSMAGLSGLANKVPYSATKFGVAGLMDALAEEFKLKSQNIMTTCAHPYFVQTRDDIPEVLDLRLPQLAPSYVAKAIIQAMLRNQESVSIPCQLRFFAHLLRMLPQDARHAWRDVFYTKVSTVNQPISSLTIA
nr:PREDICTED: retinol dehydrogenase 10-like isoform X1 [Bemisia tabaci]